ncbi:MAG: hypothetical protein KAI63_00760, partial [Planctomycetes bacterium]|nr:hypothetical protein [Planctomycetota bacterium]
MTRLFKKVFSYFLVALLVVNVASCGAVGIIGGLAMSGVLVSSSGDDAVVSSAPSSNDTRNLTSNLSGFVFEQSSGSEMVPLGGVTVMAEWYASPKHTLITKTRSDGNYSFSGINRNSNVKITIQDDDSEYTESIDNVTPSDSSVNLSAFIQKKNKKNSIILSGQGSFINTFDDAALPRCEISVPPAAVITDTGVILTPYYTSETLPAPLPDGYVPLAGSDFRLDSGGFGLISSGKEASPYVILPSSVNAEDLSSADIKLMEFVDAPAADGGGSWVITMP